MLVGYTLIRNGNKLKYPWKECLNSLNELCNQTIVNYDPETNDGTKEDLVSISQHKPRIKLYPSIWDMGNTGDGRELAHQINIMLSTVVDKDVWVVYMQADEMIHEIDHQGLREFIKNQPSHITQVELYRTYFWKDIQHRLQKNEIWLGRIFRQGTHQVGGDGMHLIRNKGEVVRSPYWIYHYSRIGNEKDITARVRTLDRLFHPDDEVEVMSDFSYSNETTNLEIYLESHPKGIEEFYNGL